MKKNFPVSGKERKFGEKQYIVSITDTKGIIISVNQDFVDISGFTEEELLNKNHNLVRHPDMPPAAFQNLWDTLKKGEPWMGIVKNRCKNGDHYWVNAYVSPILEGNQVVGYQSVRSKPKREWVDRADKLYSAINAGKTGSGLPKLSLQSRYFLSCLLMLVIMLISALLGGADLMAMGLTAAVGAVFAWVFAYQATANLRRVASEAQDIFHNDVGLMVFGSSQDELGQIELAMAAIQARQATLLARMNEAVEELSVMSKDSSHNARKTSNEVSFQSQSIQEVAVAMGQMVGAISDVAESTVQASNASQEAGNKVGDGLKLVKNMAASIEIVVAGVEEATVEIRELHTNSAEIGSLVDVIRGVAEQTNLLALNAAIEAARAGEHGRGFAVVADEVRALSVRVQKSTEEIEQVVGVMRDSVEKAVLVMEKDHEAVQSSLTQAGQATLALESISDAAGTILGMNTQIAAAAEEQSAVSAEIQNNIEGIQRVSEVTIQASSENLEVNQKLTDMTEALASTVQQFR